ncbi:MAG: hypothetical protein IJQ07_09055 [Clostridia bacterium]|nr:hypothetical protein [Clostridia bacterium]
MKSKKKTLLSAVLAIVLCMSLIAGSTFALFTSESKVNIAVTSGKVEVNAEIKGLTLYSATTENTDSVAGTIASGNHAGTYYYESVSPNFTNGGTAVLSDENGTLTLDRVTPGDKVNFNVGIANESNVNIKYRVLVTVTSGLKLFNALKVKIDGTSLTGVSRTGAWTSLAANGNISDIPVEIYLPIEAGNEYQNLSTAMIISVEAVQSNAKTVDGALTAEVAAVAEEKTEVNTETNETAAATTISDNDNLVTVSIPATTKLTAAVVESADENDELSLAVKVKPQDTVSNITILSTQASASYDVSVLLVVNGEIDETKHAIENDENNEITVSMFIGAGLTGVKLYHGVEEITYDNYNSETGYITFKTTSFSEYTVVYNADYAKETFDEQGNSTGIVVYEATETAGVYTTTDENDEEVYVTVNEDAQGNVTEMQGNACIVDFEGSVTIYETLRAAIAAANSGDTVKLLKDDTITSNITVAKDITIDLNGNTIIQNRSITSNAELLIKNGAIITTSYFTVSSGSEGNKNTLKFDNVEITRNQIGSPTQLVQLYGKSYIVVDFENCSLSFSGTDAAPIVGFTGGTYVDCAVNFIDTEIDWAYKYVTFSSKSNDACYVTFDNGSLDFTTEKGKIYCDPFNYRLYEEVTGAVIKFYSDALTLWTDYVVEQPAEYIVDANGNISIGSAEAFAWFAKQASSSTFSGKTVSLTADIDLYGHLWTGIKCAQGGHFAGTFDGNNHTINNIYTKYEQYGNGIFYSVTGQIKNLKVNNANIGNTTSGNVVGIVAGYTYGTVNFENVIVTNSTVKGFGKVGGIIGMAADPNGVTTIKDCTVENTMLIGTYNVATFIGLVQNDIVVNNCTYTDVDYELSDNEDSYIILPENSLTQNEVDVSNSIYWVYLYKDTVYYYTGWSNYYNDYIGDVVNGIEMDGHTHNVIEAVID